MRRRPIGLGWIRRHWLRRKIGGNLRLRSRIGSRRLFLRALVAVAAILCLCALCPAGAVAAPIPCSDIPDAERFVDKLKPGPNTSAARRHLEAAKRASSAGECDKELRQVDKYARRSAAADKAASSKPHKSEPRQTGRPQCADALHQDRPGGSDYHGPPVAGCPPR